MKKIIGATYNGKVLLPDEPLDLHPNTHVQIVIQTEIVAQKKKSSFINTAKKISIDAPTDFSSRLDDYLNGDYQLD